MTNSLTSITRYMVVKFCAAHCDDDGSNEDWIGVLVHILSPQSASDTPEPADARTWMFLRAYGKSGGRLQGGELVVPQTRREAEQKYETEVAKKLNKKHYTKTVMRPTMLQAFKVPLELPEMPLACAPSPSPSSPPSLREKSMETTLPPVALATTEMCGGALSVPGDELPYPVAKVEAVSSWQVYRTPGFGATEKANGERCLLWYDGHDMCAYNRNGQRITPVPSHAFALCALGVPFILDGERLVAEQANQYVVFDVLMWNGEDVRAKPYCDRIDVLMHAFRRTHLTTDERATPTLHQARTNSLIEGLMLLAPASANVEQVVAAVQEAEGEGVILRDLAAPYNRKRGILKYKFTTDLDAIVIGVKPGTNGGSLRLGLRRPFDHAIIEIGSVRSGLTPADMRWFVDQLIAGAGEYPVIKVTYLPARTVGLSLVEPSTSRTWGRTDKSAWECTTEQLGQGKESLITRAPTASGVKLSAPAPERSARAMETMLSLPPMSLKAPYATCAQASEPLVSAPSALPTPTAPISAVSAASPGVKTFDTPVRPPVRVVSTAVTPQLVALRVTTPTTQDSALLEACRSCPRTLLVDIRLRQAKAKKTQQVPNTTAASTSPQAVLSQEGLRRQWGMRYLDLSDSLGDRNERQAWNALALIAPEKGVETLSKLLEQQYNIVLLCASQGQKNLSQYIVDTYFKGRNDLRFPTAQTFAAQEQKPLEREVIVAGSR